MPQATTLVADSREKIKNENSNVPLLTNQLQDNSLSALATDNFPTYVFDSCPQSLK